MSRVVLALALALAASSSGAAGTMLYATAATTGGVTGYCVGPNGALDPTPRVNVQTQGNSPSRLITSPDGRFLYVAENNQTEVWQIGERGGLTRARSIPHNPFNGITSPPIAIAPPPDGSTHVPSQPQRRRNRVAAFPLDPATGLSSTTAGAGTSCVRDTAPAGWENLILANGLVYASRSKGAGNGL